MRAWLCVAVGEEIILISKCMVHQTSGVAVSCFSYLDKLCFYPWFLIINDCHF